MSLLGRRKILAVGGVSPFYPVDIPYSCRFTSARSTYLHRTQGSPTDANVWSFSCWIKLTAIDLGYLGVFTTSAGSGNGFVIWGSSVWHILNGTWVSGSASLLRDTTGWGHFFVKATAGSTYYYWNGQLIHSAATVTAINSSGDAYIGSYGPAYFINAYIADIHFVDGTALTPSAFGQAAPANSNVWIPKTPTGITYGNNGFHLDFSNASSLGADVSGKGNSFTSSGLTTADQRTDTPTNDCTTLSLIIPGAASSIYAPKEGGLAASYSGVGVGSARCSEPLPASKVYWEVDVTTNSNGNIYSGICDKAMALSSCVGHVSNGVGFAHDAGSGYKMLNGSQTGYGVAGFIQTLGFAWDGATGNIWLRCNGTWQGDPVAGTSPMATFSTSLQMFAAIGHSSGSGQNTAATVNFGASAFAYALPSGYSSLVDAYSTEPRPAIVTSGTFTGNASADGPLVYTGGIPETLTINGNVVTFGTHADKLSSGFKLRTASSSYNASGSNTWTATIPGDMRFPLNNAQANP